jgi:hypothetical protein
VGAVAAAGSAAYDAASGVYTLRGSGFDIWHTADEFRFAHRTLSGDGQIVARVTGLTHTDYWAKAGVMIRSDLSAGSANALMAFGPGGKWDFQYRGAANGYSYSATGAGTHTPYWVKLVRGGNTFTGYTSPDGVTWTRRGGVTFAAPAGVQVGLAVTSRRDGTLATGTFTNVSVTSAAGGTVSAKAAAAAVNVHTTSSVFSTAAIKAAEADADELALIGLA